MRSIICLIFSMLLLGLNACSSTSIDNVTKEPIRGVWLTISGCDAAFTEDGIKKAVQTCKDIGINNIFFASWNQSMVNFNPSDELIKKYPFLKKNPAFGDLDPLAVLIKEAHNNGIKLHAWFEYGFATSWGSETGGPILEAKPEWKAIDVEGNLVSKNNFQWMNAFDPAVQTFILDIIMDVVENYDVDGIQGDDRLPALPTTAGYDEYTVNKYKTEHDGIEPPKEELDEDWIQWRCDILNNYMQKIYETVSKYNNEYSKNILVTSAPSVYPWSKTNYLQDWPNWINNNHVDYVFPQVYRYEIESYKTTLGDNLKNVCPLKKDRLYPGVLIGVGSDPIKNIDLLQETLDVNRKFGIDGEVFFYYQSLTDERVSDILKEAYKKETI